MFATSPIRVLEERNDPAEFERGIFVVGIQDTVYIIAHLQAHSAVLRREEAKRVVATAAKYRQREARPGYDSCGGGVVVMGDLNTLSPRDRLWHEQQQLEAFFEDPQIPERIRKKYMVNDGRPSDSIPLEATRKIDYVPMQTMLDGGLDDLCTRTSWTEDESSEPAPLVNSSSSIRMLRRAVAVDSASDKGYTWASPASQQMSQDAVARRVQQQHRDFRRARNERPRFDEEGHLAPSPCLYTEPTSMSMVDSVLMRPFRLDYALGDAAFQIAHRNISCAVVQTAETDVLSDHFPLECRWDVTTDPVEEKICWHRI